MPFSSWLVGAMVAPTPVSALLHSSTMVKAGVYILVRFAPVFQGTVIGYTLAFVGAFTFLIASGIAISQTNAKRVLAYSTIANLGLVVACAGIGTAEAIWAAILLIIFHAISKSLMFLCRGNGRAPDQEPGDRGHERPDRPDARIAAMMVIGIAGHVPCTVRDADLQVGGDPGIHRCTVRLVFVVILIFGSALTLFFWAKWMGKLLVITPDAENVEGLVDTNEWIALVSLAGLTVITCFIFPVISSILIEPFLLANYGSVALLSQDNILIMVMMLFLLVLLPLSILLPHRKHRNLPPYMGGVPTTPDMHFPSALGVQTEMKLANYYVSPWFGEARLAGPASASARLYRDHVYRRGRRRGDPVISLLGAVVFILLAPVIGGLIAGIDRKVTAHMQGRVGPSIFQPFYDVGKLFEKEGAVVNETQRFYVISYFVFAIFTGALFFAGGNLLLVVFALTLAQIFLVLGAYAANSPYSHIGAERELIQIMAYEPMVLLAAVGMYVATKPSTSAISPASEADLSSSCRASSLASSTS